MLQILLLEPTCSITEMILLKNNYQGTKRGDAHTHTHTHTLTCPTGMSGNRQKMCYESIAKTGKDLLNYV